LLGFCFASRLLCAPPGFRFLCCLVFQSELPSARLISGLLLRLAITIQQSLLCI
jgi:hypothetical protein